MHVRIGRNLALVALGTLGGVLLAEITLRALVSREDLLAAPQSVEPRPPGAEIPLGDLLEPDGNSRLVFRLRPRVEGKFKGVPYRANSIGLRGPETTVRKPRGVVRIVGIGDSVMWGWGIAEADRYLDRAAAALSSPDVSVEAVNLAVPGYHTVQEVEVLRTRGLAFAPDVVVVGFTGNALEIPIFLWASRTRPLALDYSVLLAWLYTLRGGSVAPPHLIRAPIALDAPATAGGAWRVPSRFAHLVGMENFLAALDRLRALADAHGFVVVAVPWSSGPQPHQEAIEHFIDASRERGFIVVDVRRVLDRERARLGLGEKGFWRTRRDFHPNRAAHAVMGAALEAVLRPQLAVRRDGNETTAADIASP
jgi:hypothetical protein